jgi:ketosteroid isomerase-like protein
MGGHAWEKNFMKMFLRALLLLSMSDPMAQVGTLSEAGTTVLALENAWNQAVQLRETKALQPLLVEGLIYIDYDGRVMSKGQYLAQIKSPLLHPEHIVSESMHAQVYGDSVVVTGIYREKGMKNGVPYMLRERFIDTWVQQNRMWVCVSSQSTLIAH